MDCKPESAILTLLRIECLIVQGIVHLLVCLLLSILFIPLNPFVFMFLFYSRSEQKTRARKFVRMPYWLFKGCIMAVISPFLVLYNSLKSLIVIPWAEWANRKRSGMPKKPNGEPLEIMSDDERVLLDAAYFCSVIKDYNDEAKEHGQGFDIQ
jgi:hypothetical protein